MPNDSVSLPSPSHHFISSDIHYLCVAQRWRCIFLSYMICNLSEIAQHKGVERNNTKDSRPTILTTARSTFIILQLLSISAAIIAPLIVILMHYVSSDCFESLVTLFL